MKQKKIKKLIISIIIVLILPTLIGCGTDYLHGYRGYISSLKQYGSGDIDYGFIDNGSNSPDIDAVYYSEKYKGLKSLNKIKFKTGTEFFGDYAQCSLGLTDYVIDNSGNLSKNGVISHILDKLESSMSDVVNYSIRHNLVIFEDKNGLNGIMDINGNILKAAVYKDIEISENIVVARTETSTDIYNNGAFIGSFGGDAALLGGGFILDGMTVYDLNTLAKAELNGYTLLGGFADGLVCAEKEGKIVYLNKDGLPVIDLDIIAGSNFSGGVATVYTLSKQYTLRHPLLISASGETLFDFASVGDYAADDFIISDCVDGYVYFEAGKDFCGVIKIDFKNKNGVALTRLNAILYPYQTRVYGNYIIDNYTNGLYSLSENKFIAFYDKIVPFGSFFLVEENGKTKLLNKNLETVIENKKEILLSYDVLYVCDDNGVSYYITE